MDMTLRITEYKDVPQIMKIISAAQSFLASMHVNQWTNGYPSEDIIRADIDRNESYVLENISCNEKNTDADIMAFAMFSCREEPTYRKIYKGSWLSSGSYLVVHRMSVSPEYKKKGVAEHLLRCAENIATKNNAISIRIDTHRNNMPMRNLLSKLHYHYCGIIYLANGDERFAYEKLIKIG